MSTTQGDDGRDGIPAEAGSRGAPSLAPSLAEQREASRKVAMAAARIAAELRGQQIVVLDVSEQTPIFDCFVIATGTSRRQLVAISEEIDRMLRKELGERRLGLSGVEDGRWIVLDYGGVVVHLFDEESRAFYDLEGLWGDAKRLDLSQALRSTGALQESDLS
jgi:ribosome-associated protein